MSILKTLAFSVLAVFSLTACSFTQKSSANDQTTATVQQDQTPYKPPITGVQLDKLTSHPKRLLVLQTKQGTIKLQLFDKLAPHHVAHFLDLVNSHFYDGLTFHRVIPGFMIQGGDPNSKDDDLNNDGMGAPNQETVNAEFSEIHHARGILSTARRGNDINSATSQFFIMVADAASLDRQYTVWGQVVDGMDVVDKIVNLPDLNGRNNPGKAALIEKAYVEGE